MRSEEERKEKQKAGNLKKIIPDFERWPKSWMGAMRDLEYGKKMLPFMEKFLKGIAEESQQ
jgi:hypothetical protein